MKCYQKLFSTSYCQTNLELKELVEEKMIKKILSIDFQDEKNQRLMGQNQSTLNENTNGKKQYINYLNEIGKYILGFPSISQNTIYFIGLLFDKI
jgi:hypothetical protein